MKGTLIDAKDVPIKRQWPPLFKQVTKEQSMLITDDSIDVQELHKKAMSALYYQHIRDKFLELKAVLREGNVYIIWVEK